MELLEHSFSLIEVFLFLVAHLLDDLQRLLFLLNLIPDQHIPLLLLLQLLLQILHLRVDVRLVPELLVLLERLVLLLLHLLQLLLQELLPLQLLLLLEAKLLYFELALLFYLVQSDRDLLKHLRLLPLFLEQALEGHLVLVILLLLLVIQLIDLLLDGVQVHLHHIRLQLQLPAASVLLILDLIDLAHQLHVLLELLRYYDLVLAVLLLIRVQLLLVL